MLGETPQTPQTPQGGGRTATGERFALDPTIPTFVVTWHHGPEPTLAPSRGYPVHQCGTKGEVCNR